MDIRTSTSSSLYVDQPSGFDNAVTIHGCTTMEGNVKILGDLKVTGKLDITDLDQFNLDISEEQLIERISEKIYQKIVSAPNVAVRGSGDCSICLDRHAKITCVPCGHLCFCKECSEEYYQPRCPVCRETITKKIEVFPT